MVSFDQILNTWLGNYPKAQVPIEAAARIEALTNLFREFRKEGYKKEYFTNTVKCKIVTNCLNPHHRDKRKKKIWGEYVARHLEVAFHGVYKENVIMEENNMLSKPLSEKDMAVDTELTQETVEAVEKATKPPKQPKVEYFAENAPKGEPTVNQIDPEMAKILGLDNK